ncbi:MAG: hypothetical protein H0W18_03495, partial [Acidobacteria bacterium]|nr:hypothetical protein [Acidobacteriota bacterium]
HVRQVMRSVAEFEQEPRRFMESLLQFCHSQFNMFNIWIVGVGALALAATVAVARRLRRDAGTDSLHATVSGVSEEWLSNARAQRDETL